ncbi:MAG: hypothetical protein WAV11_00910 [Minisyncoccia bacterium]
MKTIEVLLKDLLADGVDKLQIVADFDGTLTKDFIDGQKVQSIISVLRDHPGYLSSDYQIVAKQLFAEYAPFENDLSISYEDRLAKMHEWWTKHFDLLIKSGLKLEHIEQVATSGIIQFRDGAKEFLKLTHELKIPVIIFSASGLGEALSIYCQHEGVVYDNIHFVTNSFKWGEKGEAIAANEPIIHSLNKNEEVIQGIDNMKKVVENRQNVLLLGNSLGDLEMSKGSHNKKLVTIAFVDKEQGKCDWCQKFDALATDYQEINNSLTSLKSVLV